MIKDLTELNDFVVGFCDYVVRHACENTTSGNYFINIEDALKQVPAGYDDFLEYKDLILGELSAREEILDLEYDEENLEFDVNCALDYCPHYEWCEGDEAIFGSYEEFERRIIKPIGQDLSHLGNPETYFTVRDGFGDDVKDASYPSFEAALKVLRNYCAEKGEASDGAMLGIVCKADEKTHKCVLVQNVVNKYNENVLKPMYNNISWEALSVPEIELAALKGKQLDFPFDEVTQGRIDSLEKRLGIYDRDVDTAGDLYVGKWRVHVVAPGAHYGLNNSLTHDDNRSLVEFWDMSVTKDKFPDGQFVSRYYIETLLEDKWGPGPQDLMRGGLCLDGLNADVWSVTGNEMKTVFEWLKNRELLPGEHYSEYHMDVDVHVLYEYVAKDLLSEKLNGIALVRDVKDLECFGTCKDGKGFGLSVSFNAQANKDAVQKAFAQAFDTYNYELSCEEKVVEVQKKPLDKVIKECAAQVKEEPSTQDKNKNLER